MIRTPMAVASQITGYLDGIIDGQAHGWAYTPADPSQRLVVEIVADDEIIARGFADLYRDDLRAAGVGDGTYHFKLTLSNELWDGNPHTLTARDPKSGEFLTGSSTITLPKKHDEIDSIPRHIGISCLSILLQQQRRTSSEIDRYVSAYRMASLLQETGRLHDARSAYQSIASRIGETSLMSCKIGETWLLSGEIEEALEAYQLAAANDIQFGWAHAGIGHARLRQNDLDAAEHQLRIAANLLPQNRNILARWLHVYVGIHSSSIESSTLELNSEISDGLKNILISDPDHPLALDIARKIFSPAFSKMGDPHIADALRKLATSTWLLELIIGQDGSNSSITAE